MHTMISSRSQVGTSSFIGSPAQLPLNKMKSAGLFLKKRGSLNRRPRIRRAPSTLLRYANRASFQLSCIGASSAAKVLYVAQDGQSRDQNDLKAAFVQHERETGEGEQDRSFPERPCLAREKDGSVLYAPARG